MRHLATVVVTAVLIATALPAAAQQTEPVDVEFDELLIQHHGDDLLVDYEITSTSWDRIEDITSPPMLRLVAPANGRTEIDFDRRIALDERRTSRIVDADGSIEHLERIDVSVTGEDHPTAFGRVALGGWKHSSLRIEILPDGSSVILFDDLEVEPVGDDVVGDEPRTRAERRPAYSDRRTPRHIERDQPRLSDRDRPRLSDRDRPRLSDRDRPSISDRDRPTLDDRQRPSIIDRERPSIIDRQYPSIIDRDRPSIIDRQRRAPESDD